MLGEEEMTTKMIGIFEDQQLIEMAQRVKMRGFGLSHLSTRNVKQVKIQEAFGSDLPPTAIPLEDITDYDLIRKTYNKMMKIEGMGRLWKPGQNPPQKVQDWWGPDDHDIFRMYRNQNLEKEMMNTVRNRYEEYKKSAVLYFKEKIKSCYTLRLGEGQVAKYNMRISQEEIDQIREERLNREAQAGRVEEANEARRLEEAIEERVQREVEERVAQAMRQRRVREERRHEAVERSPVRRRRDVFEDEEDEDRVHSGLGQQQRQTPAETMIALASMGDPNSSVLEREPAAVAVVRAPGPSRPARKTFKCPYGGCPITRSTEDALKQHVENTHE